MTLQEAKDEIARTIYDCKDWQDFREDGRDWRVYEDAHDLVAELLATEACREQREICASKILEWADDIKDRRSAVDVALSSPGPKF